MLFQLKDRLTECDLISDNVGYSTRDVAWAYSIILSRSFTLGNVRCAKRKRQEEKRQMEKNSIHVIHNVLRTSKVL